MNLLVTGGCGFIGSHFVNHIFDQAKHLVNLDAMYYCADEERILQNIRDSPHYTLIKENVNDIKLLEQIFADYNITHIIHFAAQSHVQNSFGESLQYTQDNVVATHTLMEAIRLFNPNVEKIIHVSTDEVYGESLLNDTESKTERSLLCPTNPYAATKAAAEMIVQSYQKSFGLPIIITRGNNVYGPNQHCEKLIPRFISLLHNNEPVTIHGDGSYTRAFLHVSDAVRGFELVLQKGLVGEIYNIGSDEKMEYTVLDIANMLIHKIKNTDKHDNWITFTEDRPFNDQRYYISNSKIKKLGWTIKQQDLNFQDML